MKGCPTIDVLLGIQRITIANVISIRFVHGTFCIEMKCGSGVWKNLRNLLETCEWKRLGIAVSVLRSRQE